MSKSVVNTCFYVLKSVTLQRIYVSKSVIVMERIVLKQLIEWKNSADRKPLILNGARQVGKTWLLQELARKEYKKQAYIVCRKNELVRQVFAQDFDVERILRALCAITGVDITPGDTLIILDEVQDIPEAIEALKYFREEAPQYHIAVAGSLLGISLHEGVSYPVGKVDEINVYPMNFREFLLAKGEDEMCKLLDAKDYQTTNLIHEKYVDLLRQYYYVGGMPEAVKKYIDTAGLQEVRKIQENILIGYEKDFSKHAPKDLVPRIRQVWKSMPSQLFKENKKFIYGVIKKGARAKEFELAIQWLVDAGLVYKVSRCTKPASPLGIYEDVSIFKLYMVDVGLLGAMVKADPATILIKNNKFTEYKGGMTEQYVLQQFKSEGVAPIFYFSADDSRLEMDFLIEAKGNIVPIEVKAEENVKANSLMNFLQRHPDITGRRYSMLPYIRQEQLLCIPLYMV